MYTIKLEWHKTDLPYSFFKISFEGFTDFLIPTKIIIHGGWAIPLKSPDHWDRYSDHPWSSSHGVCSVTYYVTLSVAVLCDCGLICPADSLRGDFPSAGERPTTAPMDRKHGQTVGAPNKYCIWYSRRVITVCKLVNTIKNSDQTRLSACFPLRTQRRCLAGPPERAAAPPRPVCRSLFTVPFREHVGHFQRHVTPCFLSSWGGGAVG